MAALNDYYKKATTVAMLAIAIIAAPAIAQTRHDVIVGRVTSDSARALAGATVIAVRTADRQFKSALTGVDGRYAIDWPDGTGDYTVRVTAQGFAPFSRHLVRTGTDSLLTLDARMTRATAAQLLAPFVVQAQRARPDREQGLGPEVGAVEDVSRPQNAVQRIGPDNAGNLAAIAGMMPGVMQVNGGISVFGLGPSQNSVTLNGMAFAASDIPRDAATIIRTSASSYDPSIGWFSGARTNVQLVPGGLFTSRTVHATLDAPPLQYGDPLSARLGQRFTTFNGSVGGDGQLVRDRYAYNFGVQASRKDADMASLVTADPDLLAHAGVSSDSVARFEQLLQQARIPVSVGSPLSAISDNVSFIGRIDHAPYDWTTLTPSKSTLGLTGYGKWSRSQALGLSPTGTPAHAGQSSQAIGSLTADYSAFVGTNYLTDVRTGLTVVHGTSDPYLALPDGTVRVLSTFPTGTGGVSSLQFGGNSGTNTSSTMWTWESAGDVQFYPAGHPAHRLKLSGDVRLDHSARDLFANQYGTFAYNSLTEFAAGQPASFTRLLNAPTRTAGEWNGFASVGDLWRVNPNLQLLYGARLEGNRFVELPGYNPLVESTFGVRTDRGPNTVAVSPRLGFTWNHAGGNGSMLPAGTVRGGVGEFRNLIDPSLLSNASVATGLPGGLAQLSCIGSAVPTPDWTAYAASPATIPRQCVASGSPSFADAAPTVQLIDPSYTANRSWRSNLAWSSTAFSTVYTIEGILSENLNQAGAYDLNFNGLPRFTTTEEGRPVYANPASIVAGSGLPSPLDARRSLAFGRVVDGVSDLQSISRQLTLTLRPRYKWFNNPKVGDLSMGYTLSSVRAQQRGFDGSTFGDPANREWARADLDARHQFVTQFVFRPHVGYFLFVYGHVQSGLPFTPKVGSDVNGDGLANDRAFVFDPSKTSDQTVASGMRSVLASSGSRVRDCLTRQLELGAARNSCEGPWTATFNANLRIDGQTVFHMPRAQLFIDLQNPLGGLDQLLHGSNGLHGWGAPALPDQVLYTVRGFDASANRFLYSVNPRFGSTSLGTNTIRAPFRLTVDVKLDVAQSFPEQQLDRWMGTGRSGVGKGGAKLGAVELAQRLRRNVPDPYDGLLQQGDSLLLSPPQVDSLQAARARYRARADSAWTILAQFLASQPDVYDMSEVSSRADKVIDDVWEITRLDIHAQLGRILTPVQQSTLSGWAGQLWRANARQRIRIYFGG